MGIEPIRLSITNGVRSHLAHPAMMYLIYIR